MPREIMGQYKDPSAEKQEISKEAELRSVEEEEKLPTPEQLGYSPLKRFETRKIDDYEIFDEERKRTIEKEIFGLNESINDLKIEEIQDIQTELGGLIRNLPEKERESAKVLMKGLRALETIKTKGINAQTCKAIMIKDLRNAAFVLSLDAGEIGRGIDLKKIGTSEDTAREIKYALTTLVGIRANLVPDEDTRTVWEKESIEARKKLIDQAEVQ